SPHPRGARWTCRSAHPQGPQILGRRSQAVRKTPAFSPERRNGPMNTASEASTLSPKAFRARFPEITVGFNWERFEMENWPVTRIPIAAPASLERFHAFFRYSLGRINGHFLHWLAMRQMRVGEVIAKLASVPEPHRSSIVHFADLYKREKSPIRLE